MRDVGRNKALKFKDLGEAGLLIIIKALLPLAWRDHKSVEEEEMLNRVEKIISGIYK